MPWGQGYGTPAQTLVTLDKSLKLSGGSLIAKLCPTLAIPWTVARQAPLSIGFSRQEYWSKLAISFFRESSRPRNWIHVSCIAGRFFTDWATREAFWSCYFPGGILKDKWNTNSIATSWKKNRWRLIFYISHSVLGTLVFFLFLEHAWCSTWEHMHLISPLLAMFFP